MESDDIKVKQVQRLLNGESLYKKGDLVKCIDDQDSNLGIYKLIKGDIYTISGIYSANRITVAMNPRLYIIERFIPYRLI